MNNSAGNGGVFYVRRFNSNIKIRESTFIKNTAENKGGVMDLGGVTLTMDVDTVIANNTAGSSGDVISACVSQITAYGLEAQLDPVYPLYCSIYDEGNSFHPTSHSATPVPDNTNNTQINSTTEELTMANQSTDQISTYTHATASQTVETTTEAYSAITFNSEETTETQPSLMTTTSDTTDTTKVTTSSSSSTIVTPQLSTDDVITPTMHSNYSPTWQNPLTTSLSVSPTPVAIGTTDYEGIPTITVTEKVIAGSQPPTSTSTHPDSNYIIIMELTSSSDAYDCKKTESDVTTLPMGSSGEEQATEEDNWNSSQRALLQVAIISLAILCVACFTVCAIMIILFFIACRRRNAPPQGYYKKVPLTEKDQDVKLSETKELGKEQQLLILKQHTQ